MVENTNAPQKHSWRAKIGKLFDGISFLWAVIAIIAYLVFALIKVAKGGFTWANNLLVGFAVVNLIIFILCYIVPINNKNKKKSYKSAKKVLKIGKVFTKVITLTNTIFIMISSFKLSDKNVFMLVLTVGYLFFTLFRLSIMFFEYMFKRKLKKHIEKTKKELEATKTFAKTAIQNGLVDDIINVVKGQKGIDSSTKNNKTAQIVGEIQPSDDERDYASIPSKPCNIIVDKDSDKISFEQLPDKKPPSMAKIAFNELKNAFTNIANSYNERKQKDSDDEDDFSDKIS